jgi:RNA-binding protein
MMKLGVASHLTRRKRIIVKVQKIPKLNTKVYDEKGNEIGEVIDVLGPVREPYVAVKPIKNENLEELVGKELFISVNNHGKL